MTPRRVTIALLLVLLACVTSGCNATSNTPTQRWAVARESLTRTQNVVLEAHKAGHVSDTQLVEADKLVQAARRALTRAEAQLPEGGSDFENLVRLAEDVATALLVADESRTRRDIEKFKAGATVADPVAPKPEGATP